MTDKETAERLDAILAEDNNWSSSRKLTEMVKALRDELYPPRPKPGTVVWWRWTNRSAVRDWSIGQVDKTGKGVYVDIYSLKIAEWKYIEAKPARILAPDEVAVKVPPVKSWGGIAVLHVQVRSPQGGVTFSDRTITRAEAERMETTE